MFRPAFCFVLLATVAVLAARCNSSPPTSPTRNIFAIRTCNDTFRVRIDDDAVTRQAAELVGKGRTGKIICGVVRAGDGGFNAPWPWHLDPRSIYFTEIAAEIYDGCPRGAENRVGSDVSFFCPWTMEVVGRE
jgi:hypothetical protein